MEMFAPINESAIIGRPVGCTISFRSRFIHFEIIGLNKPYRLGLCNKSFLYSFLSDLNHLVLDPKLKLDKLVRKNTR